MKRINLPRGYHFDEVPANLGDHEILDLWNAGGWTEEQGAEQASISLLNTYYADASIGTRTVEHDLVGTGFLVGWGKTRELAGLMVHPDHRSIGLGEAITKRRIQLVDRIGVSCFTQELEPTNTIRQKYEELGFVAVYGGLFRKSQNPDFTQNICERSIEAAHIINYRPS